MASSSEIARKSNSPRHSKEYQVVKIPKTERRLIERGMMAFDFDRYYDMRYDEEYCHPVTKAKDELETHYIPVLQPQGNLMPRWVEEEVMQAIAGGPKWEDDPVPRGHKWCGNCHKAKPVTDEFWHKNKKRNDGYQTWCKSCMGKYRKEQYKRQKRANVG